MFSIDSLTYCHFSDFLLHSSHSSASLLHFLASIYLVVSRYLCRLCFYSSVSLSLTLSCLSLYAFLPFCLSVCLSVCLSIYYSIYLSISLSVYYYCVSSWLAGCLVPDYFVYYHLSLIYFCTLFSFPIFDFIFISF